jgi:ribonuclease HI
MKPDASALRIWWSFHGWRSGNPGPGAGRKISRHCHRRGKRGRAPEYDTTNNRMELSEISLPVSAPLPRGLVTDSQHAARASQWLPNRRPGVAAGEPSLPADEC